MALNLKLADALVNAQAAAMNALFNGGKLQVYTTAQPAKRVSSRVAGATGSLPRVA